MRNEDETRAPQLSQPASCVWIRGVCGRVRLFMGEKRQRAHRAQG